jgi:transposase
LDSLVVQGLRRDGTDADYRAGVPYAMIVQRYDVPRSTLYEILERYQVPRRRQTGGRRKTR